MRRVVMFALGTVALAAVGGCQKKPAEPAKTGDTESASAAAPAAPAGPAALPHRKAGLWSQTMNTQGMHQTVKMCLDSDTDAKMAVWGQAMGDKNPCTKQSVTPTMGGWKFESECDMGQGGHMVSSGTATGDFNSHYVVKVSSTTTGSSMPQANGPHEMQIEATYEGACPAGMKGGDITMNVPGMKGGMTMNLNEMARMRAGGAMGHK